MAVQQYEYNQAIYNMPPIVEENRKSILYNILTQNAYKEYNPQDSLEGILIFIYFYLFFCFYVLVFFIIYITHLKKPQ